MKNILDNFRLNQEKEEFQTVIANIDKGVVFRGTNLWILIFAIFVASLGLNVNSTAVIIGAMLISPLMGPIMGLGMGIGINDLALLKKSLFNYMFAGGVSLITSTIYFSLSPINDAHSEILARTVPNIYDVLIAFFGGCAGILATSSKQKGNVIPGVAIATALMPPLCTAGYGLATLQWAYFIGAFYLFLINSVFIALATFITVRVLKFPYKHLPDRVDEIRAKRIIWAATLFTLLPSIYFGYDIVQQEKFSKNVNHFIDVEANIPDDFLLKRIIDVKKKSIVLIYGGRKITDSEILNLKTRLKNYDLEKATLEIKQGFAYLNENNNMQNEEMTSLKRILFEKENEVQRFKQLSDSLQSNKQFIEQLIIETKAICPEVLNISIAPIYSIDSKEVSKTQLIYLKCSKIPRTSEKLKLTNWFSVKLNKNVKIIIDR